MTFQKLQVARPKIFELSLSTPNPSQSRLLARVSHACIFHDIPQMESLLEG